MRNLRKSIANGIFWRELDDSFAEGYNEGRTNVLNVVLFALKNNETKRTKAKQEGFNEAIELIEKIKKERI